MSRASSFMERSARRVLDQDTGRGPSSSDAAIVVLSGWREGAQKVSASLLLQSACGMPLAEAHRLVDRVLEGETVEVPALHDAGELAKALRALGITAHAP